MLANRRLLAAALLAFAGAAVAGVSPQTAAGSAQPGVTATEIVIGQSAPLTGAMAQLGKRMNAGANAYLAAVNSSGGLHGRRVRLALSDDRSDPEQTRRNVEKFANDGVFVLFGTVGTASTLAAKPVVDSAGLPLVGPMAGGAALRQPVDPMIFNVRAGYADEMEQQVQEVVASGAHRIVIVYQNDAFGQSGLAAARNAMRRRGLIPVAAIPVARGSADITKALPAVAGSRPGAVLMVAPDVAAPLIAGLRSQGVHPLFYHVSYIDSSAMLSALGRQGPGVLVTQVVPFPWSRSIPIVREYQDAMTKVGDSTFDFASLEGYIAARVMVEALRRAGPALTRQTFVASLEAMENVDLGGFLVNFSSRSHSGSSLVETTMIGNKGAFIQ